MFLTTPESTPDIERIYKSSADAHGYTMNLTRAWAWRPDVFEGFAALRNQLTSRSNLSKREKAVIVCATAAALGDSYCSLAWGRNLAHESSGAAAAAVLSDRPAGELSARDHALAAWARKVVADPNRTTRADVDALRQAGFSEREIFEATAFIAFRIAFATVNDALGAAPDWQLAAEVPREVAAAVTFGRSAEPRPGESRTRA